MTRLHPRVRLDTARRPRHTARGDTVGEPRPATKYSGDAWDRENSDRELTYCTRPSAQAARPKWNMVTIAVPVPGGRPYGSTTSFPRIMFMPQANVNSPSFFGVNSMLVVL